MRGEDHLAWTEICVCICRGASEPSGFSVVLAGAVKLSSQGGETRELVLPAVAEGQRPQVLEVAGLQVSGTLAIEFAGEEGVRLSALEAVRE